MVNKLILVFFAGLMLCGTSFKTAKDDFKISIRIDGPDLGSQYWIYTITGNHQYAQIKYFFADTIHYAELRKDPAMVQFLKNRPLKMTDTTALARFNIQVDSLSINYRRHEEKSVAVTIKNNPVYFKQIDSLLHANDSILLATPKLVQGKTPIWLDGMGFKISIATGNKTRDLRLHFPDNKYYPVIHRFVASTEYLLFGKRKN